MINKVILVGNLGKDPEVRHLESGSVVATFTLATHESYRDKEGEWQKVTQWHNIVAWRSLAERIERQLKKGMLVYIDGKLTSRKYQDKDGHDRYITEVVVNTLRLLEKREVSERGAPPPMTESPSSPSSTSSSVERFDEDDLPF